MQVQRVDPNTVAEQLEAAIKEKRVVVDFDTRLEQALIHAPEGSAIEKRLFALFGKAVLSEEEVRNNFYNIMASLVTNDAKRLQELETDAGKAALTAETLLEAMHQSRLEEGQIKLLNGKLLNLENCPREFTPLAAGILALKGQIKPDQYGQLRASLLRNEKNPLEPMAHKIQTLAPKICEKAEFRRIISDVGQFCKQGLGKSKVSQPKDPTPASLEGVTKELVRKTFYEIMATHAMLTGCVTRESIGCRESFIYISLSYHAIIEVMVESRDLNGAMRLVHDKALTVANCPDKYKEFAKAIFALKDKVVALTSDQLIALKSVTVDDDASKLSEELGKLKSKDLMALAQVIADVAIEISRLDTFKEIIESVVTFIFEGKAPDDQESDMKREVM